MNGSATMLNEFLSGEGPPRLLFYFQPKDDSASPTVFMTKGDGDGLVGRCCFFVRLCDKALSSQNVDAELNFGSVEGGQTLQTVSRLMTQIYSPLVTTNTFGFTKKMKPKDKEDLNEASGRFMSAIEKDIEWLSKNIELAKLEKNDLVANVPSAINAAAANPDLVVRAAPPAARAPPLDGPCRFSLTPTPSLVPRPSCPPSTP